MRGSVVIGVVIGSLASIALALETAGPEEAHPLPSATEAYVAPTPLLEPDARPRPQTTAPDTW